MVLNALLGDLVNGEVAWAEALEADLEMSHFGIPTDYCPDYVEFCEDALPDTDPCEVFGFNWNI